MPQCNLRIASAFPPGSFKLPVLAGPALKKYGHLRVQALLARERFPPHFKGAPLLAQFSSLGSLDDKWLTQEFRGSLCAGQTTSGGLNPPSDQCCP